MPDSYTATAVATVDSSAGDGLLTIADPSTISPGHLMNGTEPLPTVLMASATSANATSAGFQPIADTAAPTTLLSYGGPVSGDQVTLTFQQAIDGNDPLHTGTYGKTFVLTLSTTSP